MDVITVILGGGRGTRLDPLTRLRSKPAVPLAGKYRLIDVPISNALHSGLDRVFVLTQFNSVSLHRHIVSTYRFDSFSRGFIDVLAAQQTPADGRWYQGTADAVRQNLGFISELRADLALILSGDHLYRCDYGAVVRDHLAHGAEVTLCVLPCTAEEIGGYGAVRVDAAGRVVEFREKPAGPAAREGMEVPRALAEECGLPADRPYLASMGIYLFDQRVLEECLRGEANDFGHEVMPQAVERCRVQAHFFSGYWRDIGTIGAFFDAHMDLVGPNPLFDFHDPDWVIYTHPRYLPGARLTGVQADRSIVSDGVKIVDSELEEAIIGIRSRIRSATIRRSLIMGLDEDYPDAPPGAPPVGIGEGAVIENAIVDKNARIGAGVRIENRAGLREAEGEGWVIRDGITVVPKNAIIPDGTVV